MTEQEREHITEGTDCWCGPRIDFYGADDEETDENEEAAGTVTV